MLPIQKKFVKYNYSKRSIKPKYIAIHDTGNPSATALNHYNYFNGGDRQSSADFFVDSNNIIQIIDTDINYSWAVGDGMGAYGITNANSCSIEMCLEKDGKPSEATINNTIELTKYLMNYYGIGVNNVVRHYDASRKSCPNSFKANNWAKWYEFKSKLTSNNTTSTPTTNTTTSTLYRVKDSKGIQLGAFSVLDNAKSFAQSKQAIVYDANGNMVISYVPVVNNYTRYAEKGIFTFNTAVTVRTAPEENAKTNVVYYAGESVNYDYVWLNKDNYNWVEYTRNNGQKGYLKIKDLSTGISYGYAK